MAKRTYLIPDDALQTFEQLVPPGRRSSQILHLIEEFIAERERIRLRREIVEGCKDMEQVYLDELATWDR